MTIPAALYGHLQNPYMLHQSLKVVSIYRQQHSGNVITVIKSWLGPFLFCSLPAWASSGCSGFLLQSKDVHVSLIGDETGHKCEAEKVLKVYRVKYFLKSNCNSILSAVHAADLG